MKKNHQIYLSLYLANLLFFSFVQVYVILSVLIFHTYDIIFKIRFGGPTTKYTKQFLHSGKNLQYFVSFQKKKKPYIWKHCLFFGSWFFLRMAIVSLRNKSFENKKEISIAINKKRYIREDYYLSKAQYL